MARGITYWARINTCMQKLSIVFFKNLVNFFASNVNVFTYCRAIDGKISSSKANSGGFQTTHSETYPRKSLPRRGPGGGCGIRAGWLARCGYMRLDRRW